MSARPYKRRRTSRWLTPRGTRRWKSGRVPSRPALRRSTRTGCMYPTRFCHVICPGKPAVMSAGTQRECPARTCWSALVGEVRHDG